MMNLTEIIPQFLKMKEKTTLSEITAVSDTVNTFLNK